MITPKLGTISKADVFNTVYHLENPRNQSLKQLLTWDDDDHDFRKTVKSNIYVYHLTKDEHDSVKTPANFNIILKELVLKSYVSYIIE